MSYQNDDSRLDLSDMPGGHQEEPTFLEKLHKRFRDIEAEVKALRERHRKALEVLRLTQWASWEYSTGWSKCPICQGWKPFTGRHDDRDCSGHSKDCALAKALEEA